MLINGIKFACNTCVKGHRSSNCNHIERPLFEIRKKGRPVTQCAFCRDLRKTRQIHIKCTCTDKIKNIENTATQQLQQQCYQCPSTKSEGQGVSYSDLIQTLLNNGQIQQDVPIQCTCHETANKMLLYSTQQQQQQQQQQEQQEPPILLPVRSQGMIIEESPGGFQQRRFLNSSYKNNRRRKSSISKRKRSSINHVDEMMAVDMQSFLFNQQQQQQQQEQQQQPEIETECYSATAAMVIQQQQFSSSATTSSTGTPNSNYIKEKESDCGFNNDIGLMMTDPAELTSLLNNVLDSNEKRHSIVEEEKQQQQQQSMQFMNNSSVEMTRSTTQNSFSSSSSIANNNNFIVPQQQLCGSFTPHSNCSPAIDTQGESVVITITPLSTLFTSDEEQDRSTVVNTTTKPMTRIVTCYCGNSCICPGCFVHPNNNYLFTMQQQQQYDNMVPPQQTSSNSSTYSSEDDEDQQQQHHMNYTATCLL